MIISIPKELLEAQRAFDAAATEHARLQDLIMSAPARKASAITVHAEAKTAHVVALNESVAAMVEFGAKMDPNDLTVQAIRRRITSARSDFETAEQTIADSNAIIDGSLSEEFERSGEQLAAAADRLHAVTSPFIQRQVEEIEQRWRAALASVLVVLREGAALTALWQKSIHVPAVGMAIARLIFPSLTKPVVILDQGILYGPEFGGEDLRTSWRTKPELASLRDALGPIAASFSAAQNVRQAKKRQAEVEAERFRRQQFASAPKPKPVPPPVSEWQPPRSYVTDYGQTKPVGGA